MYVQYYGVNVGALIERPCSRQYGFAAIVGEVVTLCRRAISDCPYNIIGRWYHK